MHVWSSSQPTAGEGCAGLGYIVSSHHINESIGKEAIEGCEPTMHGHKLY